MYRLTLPDHLFRFEPLQNRAEALEVARWAIDQAKLGQWMSTTEWGGDVVSTLHVVEHLQLGVFIPNPADAWAPFD